MDTGEEVGAAIERLYREQAGAFTRMAAAIAGPGACADAVQDGFARAYARRTTFRGEGSLSAWVWRIVLRAALDARGTPHAAALEDAIDPGLPFPSAIPTSRMRFGRCRRSAGSSCSCATSPTSH